MGSENYYSVLGIRQDATDEQVKQAFRERAKNCHPDRHPDNKEAELEFKRINTAYEGLKDAARREAYNEWLSFAQKRERSKIMQWSRLAALTMVLLLGPSALLYWAIAVADLPGLYFSTRTVSPEVAERTARMAAIKEATELEILPAPEQEESALAITDNPQNNSPADAQGGAQRQETVDRTPVPAPLPQTQPAPAQSVASTDLDSTLQPVPSEREAVATPRSNQPFDRVAIAAAPQQAVPDQPAGPRITAATQFDRNDRQISSPTEEVTQSIARETQAQAEADGQPALSGPRPNNDNIAALGNGQSGDTPSLSLPDQRDIPSETVERPQNAAPPAQEEAAAESRARAMARLIAELKEPDANGTSSDAGSADASFDADRPSLQRQGNSTEQFTDCRDCPVMALVSEIETTSDRPPLAISRRQVTMQEWNACVEEGACPSYDSFAASESNRPILNVAKRDAELYVEWLSRKTGQSYHLLTPVNVGGDERPNAGRGEQDCITASRRRPNSSWEWLDDAPSREPDCVNDAGGSQAGGRGQQSGELHGFRVARRVLAER